MITLNNKSFLVMVLLFSILPLSLTQIKRGGVDRDKKETETTAPTPAPSGGKRPTGSGRPRQETCESAPLTINCGIPGCEISVDGSVRGVTAETGKASFHESPGEHKVKIQTAGYSPLLRDIEIKCNSANNFPFTLVKLQPAIRIRTQPAESELFINGATAGKSDANGSFVYSSAHARLLIEARKPGYLPANATVNVDFSEPNPEVVLVLKPLSAQLNLTVNIPGAKVRIDDQNDQQPPGTFILHPGKHRLTIEAFGYTPFTFAIDLAPDSTEKRSIDLKRLPVADLKELAERRYRERSYEDVLRLSQYILDEEPQEPAANRLAGLAHLAKRNYREAEVYLAKGLSLQETIELPIRRHPREMFDSRKPHDSCEAFLRFTKNELEFRGKQYAADNFKVSYSQIRPLGILVKNNLAVYLATKITDASGKTREFNFYNYEQELSQSGRSYLEMLQHLMRLH